MFGFGAFVETKGKNKKVDRKLKKIASATAWFFFSAGLMFDIRLFLLMLTNNLKKIVRTKTKE